MMEYKRVTQGKITKDNVVLIRNEYNNIVISQDVWDMFANAYNRLAELEDKIEQGTLIELPCKVGDTIWVVDESWGHREDGTWGSTSEMHEGKVYSFTYYGNCLHVEDDFTSNMYLWSEEAFLTREEAEKRLKELQE